MRSYYQVSATFKLCRGKPLLVSLSLHTTSIYFPFPVFSTSSLLSHSRFFHTVPAAQGYISYLFSRHPTSSVPRPVLDAGQPLLF
jgi:hypothetical protein